MIKNTLLPSAIFAGLVLVALPAMHGCRSQTSMSSQASDSAITAKVKSKLIGESDVRARDIDVNTEEGIVYLLGRVRTANERATAERIARSCDGVRGVVNHLEVGEAS